jgi:hypothetical protein
MPKCHFCQTRVSGWAGFQGTIFKQLNNIKMKEIKSKSYTVRGENGEWLAQVVLTSDGLFASVTDYGNLSYAWRSFGDEDFRKFMTEINVGYFGTKLYTGMAYILHTRKCEQACNRFAEKILPPLQKLLKEELSNGVGW